MCASVGAVWRPGTGEKGMNNEEDTLVVHCPIVRYVQQWCRRRKGRGSNPMISNVNFAWSHYVCRSVGGKGVRRDMPG